MTLCVMTSNGHETLVRLCDIARAISLHITLPSSRAPSSCIIFSRCDAISNVPFSPRVTLVSNSNRRHRDGMPASMTTIREIGAMSREMETRLRWQIIVTYIEVTRIQK